MCRAWNLWVGCEPFVRFGVSVLARGMGSAVAQLYSRKEYTTC